MLLNINGPEDIKQLNTQELEQLASEIREYMISCCSSNPGHLGASLGTVELAIALQYVYNTPTDKIVWDVGHQAYAHKILTGRRESFPTKRKYGGISGFPKMSESEYDAFGTGHSSTSISAALGMAIAAHHLGKKEHIVAVIGDGAIGGGMAFEALNHAGSLQTDILVILNDNQISIDKNVGALHNYLIKISTSSIYNKIKNRIWNLLGKGKLRAAIQKFMFSTKMAFVKSGSLFQSLGFRYFGTIDGHNIYELTTILNNIKDIKGPKLLHIRTTKGKGYKPAEENPEEWHAPGKFDAKTGKRVVKQGDNSRYQDVFGETILELAKANSNIIGITPAMATGSSMNILMSEMPDRAFDVGIAEQHAVTFAAGMAAEGVLPYCNIYSSFLQRAYDSIIHDVALQSLKVIFCIDRGGVVGEDGPTHHGSFDLAYLRIIPNLTICAPMNEIELRNMLYSASLPQYGITTIRYPRGNGEGLEWQDAPFSFMEPGKARIMRDGKKIAILSIGTIGNKVASALDRLESEYKSENREYISPLHYDMRFLKPIDEDAVKDAASKADIIITVEDGTIIGGLHGAISEYVTQNKLNKEVRALGIPDRFIDHGSIDELHSELGYGTDEIKEFIGSFF